MDGSRDGKPLRARRLQLLLLALLPLMLIPAMVGSANAQVNGGHWLVRADVATYPFGDATTFMGPASSLPGLNSPIVGAAAAPSNGLFEVASDGGVFTFGDAHFYGSMGGSHLDAPVVGMAVTSNGGGYWLVAADGGVFSFGDAHFYGSASGHELPQPIVAIVPTADDGGYWLVRADGATYPFGDASSVPGASGNPLASVSWSSESYPVNCGGTTIGTPVAYTTLGGTPVAVVAVSCVAGAGSPPSALLVYGQGRGGGAPVILQTLLSYQDNWLPQYSTAALTSSTFSIDAYGYSASGVPRCCPDLHTTLTWNLSASSFVPSQPEPAHLTLPSPSS